MDRSLIKSMMPSLVAGHMPRNVRSFKYRVFDDQPQSSTLGFAIDPQPFNGKVVALPVAAGQTLAAGDTVVVIESMKLEHSLASPAAATVAELLVAPGQQVSPGQVLARFAPATQGAPA